MSGIGRDRQGEKHTSNLIVVCDEKSGFLTLVGNRGTSIGADAARKLSVGIQVVDFGRQGDRSSPKIRFYIRTSKLV